MSDLSDPTPVEEGVYPTPAQLLYRWESATDQERLALCAKALRNSEDAHRCFVEGHDGLRHHLERQPEAILAAYNDGRRDALDEAQRAFREDCERRDREREASR